jgi:hypothetical protein
MHVEADFLQKIWDKGIDISASVLANLVSAFVVAIIGLLLWEWNKRRELAAEREEWNHRQAEDRLVTLQDLKNEIEGFALQAEESGPSEAVATAAEWRQWIRQSKLMPIGSNTKRSLNWQEAEGRFSSVNGLLNFVSVRAELAKDIRGTELPLEDSAL